MSGVHSSANETSLLEETAQRVGGPKASEAFVRLPFQCIDGERGCIVDSLFDVSMAGLFGIEVWSIRGQSVNQESAVVPQVPVNVWRLVSAEMIPDEDHRLLDVSARLSQKDHQVLAMDRMSEMPPIQPARVSHASDRGSASAFANTAENRCVSRTSPGGAQGSQKRESHFVDEHDFRTYTSSLFLRAGQS